MTDLTFLLMGKPYPLPQVREPKPVKKRSRAYAKVRAKRAAEKLATKEAVLAAVRSGLSTADATSRAVGITIHWARTMLRELAVEKRVVRQLGCQRIYYWSAVE